METPTLVFNKWIRGRWEGQYDGNIIIIKALCFLIKTCHLLHVNDQWNINYQPGYSYIKILMKIEGDGNTEVLKL